MDDTDQSRASDAAASTRKRRSSILKSQRPARTPFSELEFNVATPTDTAKSRRVSFSRRTGVAEFVTNEATTTWKNFYEEHNKSLESSGNDSEVKAFRQPIGHLGKRIFDQQFEEVEAIDLIGTLNPSTSSNGSLNNINFTEQIAALDCTSDGKLLAPHELSALPDGPAQSKLFGNDFTVTGIGEMSGRISVNFSSIQQVHEGDDLDEIQRDLERINKVVCQGPKDHNVSEYIELDLNMTHVVKNDECDMSITDSVHNLQVQEAIQNHSIDTKGNGKKDWVADKENIAINPYASPIETDNFAVNNEPNQVLVFDGKRLTIETEKPEKDYRKTLLPNASAVTPQRKAIVLNMDDDLPNFADNLNVKPEEGINKQHRVSLKKLNDNLGQISLTLALPSDIVIAEDCQNISPEEGAYDISMTQALSGRIITQNSKLERPQIVTTETDNFDISFTQALPAKIIPNNSQEKNDKRKTIVFNDDEGDISITNVVSTNLIAEQKCTEKRKTIIFDDENADISVTRAVPVNILANNQTLEKNRTMIYEDALGNISITRTVPTNVILPLKTVESERRKTQHVDFSNIESDLEYNKEIVLNATEIERNDVYDMSITDIIRSPKVRDIFKNSTVETKNSENQVWDADTENIGIKPNIIQSSKVQDVFKNSPVETKNIGNQETDNPVIKCDPVPELFFDDEKSVKKESDFGEISITQALPTNIAVPKNGGNIFSEGENFNLSLTQALPGRIIIDNTNLGQTIVKEKNSLDISITQSLPTNIIQNENQEKSDKRKTIVFNDDDGNVSITNVIPSNVILEQKCIGKRNTIIFNDENADISLTQAVPINIAVNNHIREDTIDNVSVTQVVPSNMFLPQQLEIAERKRTIVYEEDSGDITLTHVIPPNILPGLVQGENFDVVVSTAQTIRNYSPEDGQMTKNTIIREGKNENIDIIETEPCIPDSITNQVLPNGDTTSKLSSNKRQTIIYDNDSHDISMTQIVPTNILLNVEASKIEIVLSHEEHGNKPVVEMSANISKSQIIPSSISDQKPSEFTETYNPLHVKDSWEKANEYLLSGISTNSDDYVRPVVDVERNLHKPISSAESDAQDQNAINDLLKQEETDIVITDDSNVEESHTEVPKELNIITDESRKSIILDKDLCNISVTKPILANLNSIQQYNDKTCDDFSNQMISNENDVISLTKPIPIKARSNQVIPNERDVILYQSMTSSAEPKIMDIEKQHAKTSPCTDCNMSISDFKERNNITRCMDTESAHEKSYEMEVDDSLFLVTKNTKCLNSESLGSKPILLDAILNMSTSPFRDENLAEKENKFRIIPVQSEIRLVEEFVSSSVTASLKDDAIQANEAGKENLSMENISADFEDSLPVPIDCKESDGLETLHNKLTDFSTALQDIKCADFESAEKIIEEKDGEKSNDVSIEGGNDTRALIDMISNITDDSKCDDEIRIDNGSYCEDECVVIDKSTVNEKDQSYARSRLSLAPSNRLSIAISSKEMLNNISMAQAALQNTKFELEISSQIEDTTLDLTEDYSNIMKKSVRISNEVVKTLHFEDESISETSIKSPLKKTVFGETSYMTEPTTNLIREFNKANVIPTYDINDGIKELMSDLVKPMADVLPYKKTLEHDTIVTTASKELQADLVTSSQIDIDIEQISNQPSSSEIGAVGSYCMKSTNQSFYRTDAQIYQPNVEVPQHRTSIRDRTSNMQKTVHSPEQSNKSYPKEQSVRQEILVFDHQNPLNNILLRPADNAHAHKYDPINIPKLINSNESCISTHSESCQTDKENAKIENNNRIVGNIETDQEKTKSDSEDHNLSDPKILSRNCSVDACLIEVQDTEVNTVIAMKSDKELLEASSSLTLVENLNTETSSSTECRKKCKRKSPVRVIFDVKEDDSSSNIGHPESIPTTNEDNSNFATNRAKKRSHNPLTPTKSPLTNVAITPKPNLKIQKLSNSPKAKITPEKDVEIQNKNVNNNCDGIRKKKPGLKLKDKLNSSVTVQHLITEFNVENLINESLNNQTLEAPKSIEEEKSSEIVEDTSGEALSSCNSSKNFNNSMDPSNFSRTSSMKNSTPHSIEQSSKIDWQPELRSSLSSDCDSGVNIVAKIDMLPFMGSHECEWDSAPADTWCFRLLHGRIRLSIRLEHRHDNATRTRVRADTRVIDISIETIQQDKKNPLANLCVRFAWETFRYMVSHGGKVRRACDVPHLLRRGAGLARTALRWARAMHDAKLHLAYTMDTEGHLSLKVANIPLRSVWEVSMDLELVVENAKETPWPRACNVRVTRVVSDVTISEKDVESVISQIPKDWGHVPRTLWRIFKYLKHKTQDDEALLGGQHF